VVSGTTGAGEINIGAGAVRGGAASVAFPETPPWVCPGGFATGFDAREMTGPLGRTVLQSETPDTSPLKGFTRPERGPVPISPWMRGGVPADGIEWVKIGLAAASEIGSERSKSSSPGRGKTNVRSIT